MNKSLATLAAVLIGLAVLFSFLDKPDDVPQPPEPKANIAAQARESFRAQALMFANVCAEAKKDTDEGKLTAYEVAAKAEKAFQKAAQEAFRGLDEMYAEAQKAGTMSKAWEDAGIGFEKVGNSIR